MRTTKWVNAVTCEHCEGETFETVDAFRGEDVCPACAKGEMCGEDNDHEDRMTERRAMGFGDF